MSMGARKIICMSRVHAPKKGRGEEHGAQNPTNKSNPLS